MFVLAPKKIANPSPPFNVRQKVTLKACIERRPVFKYYGKLAQQFGLFVHFHI